MRFASAAFIAAATAGSAYASFDACIPGDYETWMVSFMQGFQEDPDAVDTDCYFQVNLFSYKVDLIYDSIDNFDSNDWAAPLYAFNDSAVAISDLFVSCQTTNFAKQMSTRFSTLAGIFDLVSTIGVSFIKEYRAPGESPLYNAMVKVNDAETCAETANNAGQFLHYAFNYQVPKEVYSDELGQDLSSEIFD